MRLFAPDLDLESVIEDYESHLDSAAFAVDLAVALGDEPREPRTRRARAITLLTPEQVRMEWARRQARAHEVVYFFRLNEFVKIGRSIAPEERLKELQIGVPYQITFEATIPGGHSRETLLHWRFRDRRERGEWFRLSTDDVRTVVREFVGLMIEDGLARSSPRPP